MELEEAFRERACASGGGGGYLAGGPDRLSALPDCLLHTIMSFMKARQAVQTCVLSTRWRHLWRSVPCLDVDFDEFKKTANSDKKHKDKYRDWEDFEDFTVNLMHCCNIAQLDSFRLHIVGSRVPGFGDRHAAGWFRRAMKYCAPDRCSQLVGLSSGSWHLKRLHLCNVRLDNRFVKHFSSVCRSLEDLELDDCLCDGIQSVTSHSLKTLVLKNCKWRNLSEITSPTLKTLVIDGGWNTDDCVLVILIPAVAYMHLAVYVHCYRGGISINEVPSLAKASIHLQGHRYAAFSSKLAGDQFELLCSLSNATTLEVSGVGTRVLGKENRFQEFKNLRNLLLYNCDLSDDFHTLAFFLQSSPILLKLTLRHCQFPKYHEKKNGKHKLNKTSISEFGGLDFMCENLKVEIIYTDGDAHQLVKLLLGAAGNLSKNHIKLTKVN